MHPWQALGSDEPATVVAAPQHADEARARRQVRLRHRAPAREQG